MFNKDHSCVKQWCLCLQKRTHLVHEEGSKGGCSSAVADPDFVVGGGGGGGE